MVRSKAKTTKRGKRTRETGLVVGNKEPQTFQTPQTSQTSQTPQTSRAARKQHQPRKDSVPALLQLCPYGWDFSEDIALQKGTAEKGYYLHETRNVDLTPEDAFDIHVHHSYDSQRKQDDNWAKELAENMVTAVGIDLAIGPGGKACIVNGQHTLWAIYLRNRTTPASISIYQCRDEQAIADLYAIFDSLKVRTGQQVIHAAQNANALHYDGTANRLVKWSSAVAVAENGFTRKSMGKQGNSKKVELAKREDVQKFADWMDSHVTEVHHTKLVPQAIAAALFAMFTSDLPNAEQFACGYFRGVGLEEGNPILAMRNKMINRPKNLHMASAALEIVQFMYSAWRKFCMDETLVNFRKTMVIPDCDKWRIYESSQKTIMLRGNRAPLAVAGR